MKLTKEDFLSKLKAKIGDDTSDEAIQLIEDFTDTYNELEKSSSGPDEWKKKYEDNDATWRKKYRDRFFGEGENPDEKPPTKPTEKEEPYNPDDVTIESLFKESEG